LLKNPIRPKRLIGLDKQPPLAGADRQARFFQKKYALSRTASRAPLKKRGRLFLKNPWPSKAGAARKTLPGGMSGNIFAVAQANELKEKKEKQDDLKHGSIRKGNTLVR